MRTLALLLLLPAALAAQSIQTIAPQRCVWHVGENSAWGAPAYDDFPWQSYSNWNPLSPEPHIWIRCHSDLSSLRTAPDPALQITLYAAYQAYFNGRLIGAAGNLNSGAFTLNIVRELFGFERTRQISTQPAEAIAAAAQAFGQEDDITVLTLTFAPAEVLHA
jgi:hypothetical protein